MTDNKVIYSNNHQVEVGPLKDSSLNKLVYDLAPEDVKKFILVDEHTLQHCFRYLMESVPSLRTAEVLEIESGEQNKNITICNGIWEAMAEMEADRHALFLNLGGGVITDMGGFIASTYKRGIHFINIPTTLLSQVDASVGGKVGIDLGSLKNAVGLFSMPQGVFIDPHFLNTLSKREILSGFAEMIKHSLITSSKEWESIREADLGHPDQLGPLIHRSIVIKNEIVQEDPTEKGLRKVLNFGHTIGHAIESYSMETARRELSHGESVAIGMIIESWLSVKYAGLKEKDFEQIDSYIRSLYPSFPLEEMDNHRLIELMRNDKKNKGKSIRLVLLEKIGSPMIDVELGASEIMEALDYYRRSV